MAAKAKQNADGYARRYDGAPTPWYDRFTKLAALRTGRERPDPETHGEYAGDVSTKDPELKHVATAVTGEYYRVRFGRKIARPTVLSDVESEMESIEEQSKPAK